MALPYEILIRCNGGVYSGTHVIDAPGGAARAVKPADFPAVATAINAAALARVAELETGLTAAAAAHTKELEVTAEALAKTQAAIKDSALDAEATLAAIEVAIAESKQTEEERRKSEVRKKIAELEASLVERVAEVDAPSESVKL